MNESQHLDEAKWTKIALGRYIHQEMHEHIIQLDLGYCLKKFLFAVFGSSLIAEELL